MENSTMKRLALASAVGGVMAVSMPAMAETFNTTATVSNTITLNETTALNFGTLFAVHDSDGDDTTLAAFQVSTAGAATVTAGVDGGGGTASKVVGLGGHAAGQLDVTGAAAFTDLTVTSGGGLVDLTHESGSPNAAAFTMTAIVTDPANAATGQTDASGNLSIDVGGTITTTNDPTDTSGYLDGVYTGSYDVSVSY